MRCEEKYQVTVVLTVLGTMLIFLSVLLINVSQISGAEEEDVLYFEDIQSDQQRAVWDKLPLISQTRTASDWCEVNSCPTQLS